MRTLLGLACSLAGALLLGCPSEPTSTTVTTKGAGAPTFSHPTAVYDEAGRWNVLIADDANLCASLQFIEGPNAPIDIPGDGGSSIPSLRLELNTGKFMDNDFRTVGDDMDAQLDLGGPLGAIGNDGGCQEPAPMEVDDGGPFFKPAPCRNVLNAVSGSAHLFHADGPGTAKAHASGTFDVTFPDGGELQGSFVAAPCSQVDLATGCSAAAGSALFPLLALVGALARRRRRS